MYCRVQFRYSYTGHIKKLQAYIFHLFSQLHCSPNSHIDKTCNQSLKFITYNLKVDGNEKLGGSKQRQ
jgi:hypothetical protein